MDNDFLPMLVPLRTSSEEAVTVQEPAAASLQQRMNIDLLDQMICVFVGTADKHSLAGFLGVDSCVGD